ncbi:Pisatin demethylase [Beauveria bassiana D1-5]|uniref:Pisatin demethylase n=1 Tax=Beauveria bassiana D1-5 TaxID=1245745 RepID=A0A0A2VXR7_BEABA|nr:Pisatin demethylase [Beauveria bassiana D1-5]
MSGVFPQTLKEATDRYGPLVRIGPNQLVSSDPEVLRRMSAVRGNYVKARFYKAARVVPGVDNVVSALDEDKHKTMRAQMNSTFTVKGDEEYGFESAMDRQIQNFVTMLETKYTSAESEIRPVDMAEKIQFLALDIIGDISLGKPFGYLKQDRDLYNFNEINMSSLPILTFVSILPGIADVIHTWPFRLALPKEGDQVGFGRLLKLVTKSVEIAMHRNEAKEGALDLSPCMCITALLLLLLLLLLLPLPRRANVHARIAGSNTTAHSILMTLLSLIAAPTAFKALQKEIDEASASFHDPISWHEIRQLPYLQAVIKESLRMWPPVSGLGFKLVPPGGKHINGYFVPGGTEIGQAFLAVGRSRQIWGADADVFRPERWLCASQADLTKMNKAVDTHFGGGKFSCLGKPIAMMELHKTVYELMKRFDMAIIHPDKPMKTKASIFVCDTDFWVTLRKRPAPNECQKLNEEHPAD